MVKDETSCRNQGKLSVSIVIPVFNEERTIGDVITRTRKTLDQLKYSYEVLVVDDGSFDRSGEVSYSSKAKVLRVDHQGKGRALRYGFEQAKGNVIVTLDSDGSHMPEEIPILLKYIARDSVELVIGSRFLSSPLNHSRIPYVNRVGNQMFNNLIFMLTGVRVTDSQSGFRAIKSSVLEKMQLNSLGYEVESEMLVKALRKGVRFIEIPITFEQRTVGRSRLDPLRDGMKILYSIITSRLS